MQIMSMAYTDSRVNDCEVVEELSKQVIGKVTSVRADGAYDTEKFYKIINHWEAKALIPPAITSKAQDELVKQRKLKKEYLSQRDSTIKMIREYENFEIGLKQWKITSGYHRRSVIKSCMFRFKKIFGFSLQHKTIERMKLLQK